MPRFLTSIRAKLVLATLMLLVIPWVGYKYVKAMENLLRESQVQTVVATARAVATALQDRPRLLELRVATPAEDAAPTERPVSEEIQPLVTGLARAGSRVWVVDSRLRLVAVAGSLEQAPAEPAASPSFGPLERAVRAMLRPLFDGARRSTTTSAEEVIPNDVVFGGRDMERALDGTPSWRLRTDGDGRAILTAVHPVWVGDNIVAAAVVEETTQPILSFSNRAIEQLAAVTLIAFCAGALMLFIFASGLSSRLRKLRDEAESAIDSQGRVRGLVSGESAQDEIGDLSRGFSTVLERLAQYNDYLENMAGRLSHELRTPVAVVRTSLDNLKLQAVSPEARTYVERATEGLNRLDTLLTRISEATRLEHMVREAERERFDAQAVTAACVSAYASVYPARRFELHSGGEALFLNGDRDLYAQMLDKLAANAADFATGDDPVTITLSADSDHAMLTISNRGPLLPDEMRERLFHSMVSVRPPSASDVPHLGLGLYIARLIAEFHGGGITAANLADGSGVKVEVRMPLAR